MNKELVALERLMNGCCNTCQSEMCANLKNGACPRFRDYKTIEISLKALEIIKETPIFAWYVTIYKDAYEMVCDAKGFRVNESVKELQIKFNLLKEVLK